MQQATCNTTTRITDYAKLRRSDVTAGCQGWQEWTEKSTTTWLQQELSLHPSIMDEVDEEDILGDHVAGHGDHRCIGFRQRVRKPYLLWSRSQGGIEMEGAILLHCTFLVAKA